MDLEQKAIERIRLGSQMSEQYYGEPLICTYSGGKDSDVMLELFKRSGVEFEVVNSHTTADAPPTVYHIKEVFKNLENENIKCNIVYPTYKGKRTSMWELIPQKKMPPTQLTRYCCDVLKETSGANRCVATGVRWAESLKRKNNRTAFETITKKRRDKVKLSDEIMLNNDNSDKRKLVEHCIKKGKMIVNPIIDWTDNDIWNFIRSENINTNIMYEMGYKRVGCVGCPMATYKQITKEFRDFPAYKKAYLKAFDRMLKNRTPRSTEEGWKTAEEVFEWWIRSGVMQGQITMFEDDENAET